MTTERLTLRQLLINDLNDILALRSDTEVNKYLDRQPSKTIEDAINFINSVNDNIQLHKSLYWAITLTRTKAFVGTISVFDYSDEKYSCAIGYELLKKFWGQGIMKEAAGAVIDYVFQTLKFKNILAFTHSDNQSSTQLLTRLNFVKSTEVDKENRGLNIFTLTQ